MRAVPSDLDPSVVAEIDSRLLAVATEHNATVLWAIESGSRAWGFPSPDSDYDCRFLYVLPRDAYLSLWQTRDVIETPLDKIFDVNGWDVAKAIRLMVKGNATVTEWLRSPIVYSGDASFRDSMLELAAQVIDPVLLQRHYLHVGRFQWDGDEGPVKRTFYALRAAASLRWLRHNEGVPPMDLPTLLAESSPSADVLEQAAAMIAAKAVTREMGVGAAPTSIARFVLDEFELAAGADEADLRPRAEVMELADEYFRSLLS